PEAVAATLAQPEPEPLLKVGHVQADGGAADVERRLRAGVAARLDHRHEHAQEPQIDIADAFHQGPPSGPVEFEEGRSEFETIPIFLEPRRFYHLGRTASTGARTSRIIRGCRCHSRATARYSTSPNIPNM